MSNPFVKLIEDFSVTTFHGKQCDLKTGDVGQVIDENKSEGVKLIYFKKFDANIMVPANIVKVYNVPVDGGKKKRTKRNKRVKSRRRIKGKSVRRRK
jgi:hypothetical protein